MIHEVTRVMVKVIKKQSCSPRGSSIDKEGLKMKVIAFNGSPRKKWNTGQLLEKALEGASSQGAETEIVHLYDMNYKGCISCFSCKTKNGKSYGRCAVKDDLTPVFAKVLDAKALIFGSPIYLGTATGQMRSFFERLVFPFLPYTDPPESIFPGKIRTGFIYTLGATEDMAKERGFDQHINLSQTVLERIFGASESLCSYDTYQFEDYSKMFAPRFDPEKKAQRRREIFPLDCAKAFEMGARLAKKDEY
jgi:multimeric flavodoxin WrbA